MAYRLHGGSEPVRDWLKSLPRDDRRIVGVDIATVEFGWPIGMPLCRPLGGGLWEVRSKLTQNRIGRVIFCVAEGIWSCCMPSSRRRKKHQRRTSRSHADDRRRLNNEKNKHIGSSFDDFLKEEGIRDEARVQAVKRVIAWQIAQQMAELKLRKNQMAKRMKTSRTQVRAFA
jgi:hypothetical protein